MYKSLKSFITSFLFLAGVFLAPHQAFSGQYQFSKHGSQVINKVTHFHLVKRKTQTRIPAIITEETEFSEDDENTEKHTRAFYGDFISREQYLRLSTVHPFVCRPGYKAQILNEPLFVVFGIFRI